MATRKRFWYQAPTKPGHLSPLHTKVRALIAAAAFPSDQPDEAQPDFGLAFTGQTLAALIRRKVVFVPSGSHPLTGAERAEMRDRVSRAWHDGCHGLTNDTLRDANGDFLSVSGAHRLEDCALRQQNDREADAIFAAIEPYLAFRQADPKL